MPQDDELIPSDFIPRGIKPLKQLGQNFLVNSSVLKRFLDTAELSADDIVVEIGAGTGIITAALAARVKKVISVEKDAYLIPLLEKNLATAGVSDKVAIIEEDALKMSKLKCQMSNEEAENGRELSNKGGASKFKVVGAIPYQITSPLLHCLLKMTAPPALIVFIVQKEVADKITAKPPRATYLSNFVQKFAAVECIGRPISPAAFWPMPKVESRIIKFRPKADPPLAGKVREAEKWEGFLHRGFSSPRKMLKKSFPEALLRQSGVSPQARPQELALAQWEKLFDNLKLTKQA